MRKYHQFGGNSKNFSENSIFLDEITDFDGIKGGTIWKISDKKRNKGETDTLFPILVGNEKNLSKIKDLLSDESHVCLKVRR